MLVAALLGWKVWWTHGPSQGTSTSSVRTVYANPSRAILPFTLGLLGAYYALFVMVSLGRGRLTPTESLVHLTIWTLAPPFWFFVEWFYWFDNHANDKAVHNLGVAQDLSGRLWAAVLAVMLAYRLGDIVTAALEKKP
jgi:hypothetical protein